MILTLIITTFLLFSCSKEKQTEKMLYGEWEVTSFMHGANDLTQFYKDSCGCRLLFIEYNYYNIKPKICILKCSFNNWNYYYSDSLSILPWRNHGFQNTSYEFSENWDNISWYFGNAQPESIYRWGMYPLTISISPDGYQRKTFIVEKISKDKLTFMFTDSINETYIIQLSKFK